jgi:hypothetical protein
MLQNMQSGYKKDIMLQAISIVDNKFWIIERNGQKVGTLRRGNDYVLTVASKNTRYPDLDSLLSKLDIRFDEVKKLPSTSSNSKEYEVHGYPCKTNPHNSIFDLKRRLPLYTKTEKSQSFYCAGYYVINFDNGWVRAYCPKLITLSRNEYSGPFKSKLEMLGQIKANV